MEASLGEGPGYAVELLCNFLLYSYIFNSSVCLLVGYPWWKAHVIKRRISTEAGHDLISLYKDFDDDTVARDSPFKYSNGTCDYYEAENIYF